MPNSAAQEITQATNGAVKRAIGSAVVAGLGFWSTIVLIACAGHLH